MNVDVSQQFYVQLRYIYWSSCYYQQNNPHLKNIYCLVLTVNPEDPLTVTNAAALRLNSTRQHVAQDHEYPQPSHLDLLCPQLASRQNDGPVASPPFPKTWKTLQLTELKLRQRRTLVPEPLGVTSPLVPLTVELPQCCGGRAPHILFKGKTSCSISPSSSSLSKQLQRHLTFTFHRLLYFSFLSRISHFAETKNGLVWCVSRNSARLRENKIRIFM